MGMKLAGGSARDVRWSSYDKYFPDRYEIPNFVTVETPPAGRLSVFGLFQCSVVFRSVPGSPRHNGLLKSGLNIGQVTQPRPSPPRPSHFKYNGPS